MKWLREHREFVHAEVRRICAFPEQGDVRQRLYFILARSITIVHGARRTDSHHIKIGIAGDPEKRMRRLQTGSFAELTLLGASPPLPHAEWIEQRLHEVFRDSRVRGEWFKFDARILATMHDLCQRPEVWRSLGVAA